MFIRLATGFDQTSKTVVHSTSKAAESKQNKQVSRTVILPLKLVLSIDI